MGFGAVGFVMLAIVLLFYLRMMDARARGRRQKDSVQIALEKAAVFESVADDRNALKVVDAALVEYTDNVQLMRKRKELLARLEDQ